MKITAETIQLHKQQAIAQFTEGYTMGAKQICEEICRIDDSDPEIWCLLAVLNGQLGQFKQCIDCSRAAIRLYPDYADAHYARGIACQALRNDEAAIACFEQVIRLKEDHFHAYKNLGEMMEHRGDHVRAIARFRKAQQLEPRFLEAFAGEAGVYERQGDYQRAYEVIRPFLNDELDNAPVAAVYGQLSRTLGQQGEAVALMERLLERHTLDQYDRRQLHFMLGIVYDDIGQYDRAFYHYQEGNRYLTGFFDRHRFWREIDNLINRFSREEMTMANRSHCLSECPVFVVGMPRSGTSLVEQILASHPSVHGAGELGMLNRIVTSASKESASLQDFSPSQLDRYAEQYLAHIEVLGEGRARIVDKMPYNYLYLGYIALLFPRARIIHCARDPLDTCLSCFFQDFAAPTPQASTLENTGIYYRGYRKLMAHWDEVLPQPLLNVSYEELVANPELQIRRLLDYCGLEWDQRCLEFHTNKRVVTTASYDQVRKPLYTTSIGRWRNYERHLEPLIDALNNGSGGSA